jgi:hypothetical protein
MQVKSLTFKEEKCVLLVNIEMEHTVPDYVNLFARENNFNKKNELHITIIGNSEGKKLLSKIDNKKIENLRKLINESDWSYDSSNEFFHIKKQYQDGAKESIIELVKIVQLEKNLEAISKVIGQEISVPFTHITLFTKNDNEGYGIGVSSHNEFLNLKVGKIVSSERINFLIEKIYIPSRIQVDTSIALFLLQKFGKEKFKGIENAAIQIEPVLDNSKSEKDFLRESVLLLDVGGGSFDHHNKDVQTTTSAMVAKDLGIENNKTISKFLALADRDDVSGKGIISNDVIDKSFGLPGLIVSLNRQFDNDPNKVYKAIAPLLEAHYQDEFNAIEGLPKEIGQRKMENDFFEFRVSYRGRPISVCMTTSDDSTMPGYLRSKRGGEFDVVALWRKSGHINIITKQFQKLDLRSLTALIRKSEAMLNQLNLDDMNYLASPQRINEVLNWYYDTATNSLQNGGIMPTKNTPPTKISKQSMIEILKLGLVESLWNPNQ